MSPSLGPIDGKISFDYSINNARLLFHLLTISLVKMQDLLKERIFEMILLIKLTSKYSQAMLRHKKPVGTRDFFEKK